MACRVGMSKYPHLRMEYWKAEEGHTYDKILHEGKTYDQALRLEKIEAEARGCHSHPGR